MLRILFVIVTCFCTLADNPLLHTRIAQASTSVDQENLERALTNGFTNQATNIQAMLNTLRDEVLTLLLQNINEIKNLQINSALSSAQPLFSNPNLNGNGNTAESLIFPGTEQDYSALLRIMMKSSRCGSCITCNKGGMCMLNTFKVLSDIVEKYPQWTPPTEITLDAQVHPLLSDVLKDIQANKDNSDPLVLMWLTNAKLKHLLNPVLQLAMKMPSKKSKSSFNPALLLLAQGKNKIDPVTMMMLSQGKIDPMFLALQQGGKIDPMMLAMMNSKDGEMGQSALMYALMNKNNSLGNVNLSGGTGEKTAQTCNAKNAATATACNGSPRSQATDNLDELNPLLFSLLLGKEVDPMLLYTLLNSNTNEAGSNIANVAETLGRYGKQLKELSNSQNVPVIGKQSTNSYGVRYGKQ